MRGRSTALATAGFDAIAVKPSEVSTLDPGFDGTIAIDFEGLDHLPPAETVDDMATGRTVVVTAPIRVDGFDPHGDDRLLETYGRVAMLALVAGNGVYLAPHERRRGVAPRLREALDRFPDAWVGTEGIERVALSTEATQYELLSRTTAREIRAMRVAGFAGDIALYAPTVLTDDEDLTLDALGDYVARRRPVADRLPDGAPTDATARGRTREILLDAIDRYAIVGAPSDVATRIEALRAAGVSTIVGYPAAGAD